MEKESIIQYINEFKKILSYVTSIGFFFGAGTSCAFGLPNIGDLTKECKKELREYEKDFDNIEKTIRDLEGKQEISIEDLLNYIRQVEDLTKGRPDYNFISISGNRAKELDKKICETIFKVIKEKEEISNISDLRRFVAWYDSTNRGLNKEIYTTNYDMLLEMALEANFIPYFDGFVGAYEPFFSPESIDFFSKEQNYIDKWIHLWKIHGSLNWMKKEKTSISPERIARISKIEKPINELMIYPSKEKYNLSRKEPFIAFFDRMKEYLKHGELLYICSGYSFSDQHINEIIFNALHQNKRLYVIVFCYEDVQVDEMSKYATAYMNLCIIGPKKMIRNGIEREWEFDEEKESNNEYKLYWDDEKQICKLGDFKNLIEFLIENSGRKSIIEEIINGK